MLYATSYLDIFLIQMHFEMSRPEGFIDNQSPIVITYYILQTARYYNNCTHTLTTSASVSCCVVNSFVTHRNSYGINE